ncbi:hypothetical protein [Paracoccus fontiphilus]|uniref:Uncharacterized protein n=1 Tax=Paracoccus fontiphilus TaxID=1815556 RepID=A0ABV7IKG7_9RHOB|nr:hypothetical protein [Paracoccus fontiphilus]
MTALTEFQRLEAQGSWRAAPDASLREVIVSVGDATLVLSDPKNDRPLSHWSLPAVVQLNPGTVPAIYAPSIEGSDETVEIDDPLMIQAISRVQGAIAVHRSHTGRLRSILLVLGILGILGFLVFWLPGALVAHAARIAPPAQARDIGFAILADLERTAGAVCNRASGQAVLDHLTPQLLDANAIIRVVPGPLGGARRLPGGLYVIGSDLLQTAPGPEAAAAHLVAARLATEDDGLRAAAISHAGFLASLRLMTLGHLPPDAMAGFGATMLQQAAPRPGDAKLLSALEERRIPAEPYARSIDPTGQTVQPLIEGDPFRGAPPARPLLTDEQWLALQQICAG